MQSAGGPTGGHAVAYSFVFHIGVGGLVFDNTLFILHSVPLSKLIVVQAFEFGFGAAAPLRAKQNTGAELARQTVVQAGWI
jgi:hypothetical protein